MFCSTFEKELRRVVVHSVANDRKPNSGDCLSLFNRFCSSNVDIFIYYHKFS